MLPPVHTTTMDLTTYVPHLVSVVSTAITGIAGLLGAFGTKTLATFNRVKLTDQQRAIVLSAVKTAAGTIETLIDQNEMHVAHVTTVDANVQRQAAKVIADAPDATQKLGLNQGKIAEMIVGEVDTKGRTAQSPAPKASIQRSGVNGVHRAPSLELTEQIDVFAWSLTKTVRNG